MTIILGPVLLGYYCYLSWYWGGAMIPKKKPYRNVKFSGFCSDTIYTRNNMGQKCEGNCGLWVRNEILKKTYAENLKKIVGAAWELPAK
jgi:hypothetical protein